MHIKSPFLDEAMEESETPGAIFAKDTLAGYPREERPERMNLW